MYKWIFYKNSNKLLNNSRFVINLVAWISRNCSKLLLDKGHLSSKNALTLHP
jgi:hypothetical protein